MKNIFRVLGIIALVAVIGFSMVACDDGGGGGGNGNIDKLTAGSGKWIKDDGSGRYFLFEKTDSYGGALKISFYNGTDENEYLEARIDDINFPVSGNTVKFQYFYIYTITLKTSTTINIDTDPGNGWYSLHSGDYTLVE